MCQLDTGPARQDLLLRRGRWGALLCALLLAATPAQARQLFISNIAVEGETNVEGSNRIRDVADFYTNERLEEVFGDSYVSNDTEVQALQDFRGLRALVFYPEGSSDLVIAFPGVIDQPLVFTGDDRDEAADKLEDWLKGELEIPGVSFKDFLRGLVLKSPVDPVAGNPNSLEAKMMVADWKMGTRGPLMQQAGRLDRGKGLFTLEAEAGSYEGCESGCMDVKSVDLYLSYAYHFRNRRVSLFFDLPFAVTWTEDEESLLASAGLAAQFHLTDWWSFTANARFGGAGSVDVGALAIIWSLGVVNRMEWQLGPVELGMGNQFTHLNTFDDISISGVDFEYDLRNEVLRNGLDLGGDLGVALFQVPVGWEVFGVYNVFFGTELFLEEYGEVGAALTGRGSFAGAGYDRLRLEFKYSIGDDYTGYRFQLGYRF